MLIFSKLHFCTKRGQCKMPQMRTLLSRRRRGAKDWVTTFRRSSVNLLISMLYIYSVQKYTTVLTVDTTNPVTIQHLSNTKTMQNTCAQWPGQSTLAKEEKIILFSCSKQRYNRCSWMYQYSGLCLMAFETMTDREDNDQNKCNDYSQDDELDFHVL